MIENSGMRICTPSEVMLCAREALEMELGPQTYISSPSSTRRYCDLPNQRYQKQNTSAFSRTHVQEEGASVLMQSFMSIVVLQTSIPSYSYSASHLMLLYSNFSSCSPCRRVLPSQPSIRAETRFLNYHTRYHHHIIPGQLYKSKTRHTPPLA